MVYFIAWAVFLLLCIIALPVVSVLGKPKIADSPGYDSSSFTEDEYAEGNEVESLDEDAFGGEQVFEDAAEPVADDFSAFEEEFN